MEYHRKLIAIHAVVTRTTDGWTSSIQIPEFFLDMTGAWLAKHTKEQAWQYATEQAVERARRVLDPHETAEMVSISAVSPEPWCTYATATYEKE